MSPLYAAKSRARAFIKKIRHIRIRENTRSSICRGGGNCGNWNFPCQIKKFFPTTLYGHVVKVGIPCGNVRENRHLLDEKGRNRLFWSFPGRDACRCGENPDYFGGKPRLACPQEDVEEWLKIIFLNRLLMGFSTSPHLQKGWSWRDFVLSREIFRKIHKEFWKDLCKTLPFPHSFQQLVEKWVENPQ